MVRPLALLLALCRREQVRKYWAAAALVMACAISPAASLVAQPRTAPQAVRCDGSTSQRGENVPVNTSDHSHEVIHALSFSRNGSVLFWIYQDRNGTLWLEGNGRNAPYGEVSLAARAFGAKLTRATVSGYSLQISGKLSPAALRDARITVHGCY